MKGGILKGGPFTYETLQCLRCAHWYDPQFYHVSPRAGFRTFRRAREVPSCPNL